MPMRSRGWRELRRHGRCWSDRQHRASPTSDACSPRSTTTLIDDDEAVDQEVLFHAWNAATTAAPILFTARVLPRQWVTLPDLGSRLAATPTLIIGPPDDALLANLLVKHFADRGVRVAADVVAFVIARIERSFAAVAATAVALDAAALAAGREVTVPLARTVLDGQGELLGE